MKILDKLFAGFAFGLFPRAAIWVFILWMIGGIPVMQEEVGYDPWYNPGPLIWWITAGIVVGLFSFMYGLYRSTK
jgi:hypothetical protein